MKEGEKEKKYDTNLVWRRERENCLVRRTQKKSEHIFYFFWELVSFVAECSQTQFVISTYQSNFREVFCHRLSTWRLVDKIINLISEKWTFALPVILLKYAWWNKMAPQLNHPEFFVCRVGWGLGTGVTNISDQVRNDSLEICTANGFVVPKAFKIALLWCGWIFQYSHTIIPIVKCLSLR